MKHRHRAASLAVAAVLTVALTATGCGTGGTGTGAGSSSGAETVRQPADCGECVSETADLADTISTIDGVRRIVTIRRVTARGITRLPGVRLELLVQPGTVEKVAEDVAEAAWKSKVSPLKAVNMVSIDRPDADPRVTRILYENDQLARYEADWGPRPSS